MAASTAPDLTHDDVAKILKLIDEAPHLDEIRLEFGGVHLHVRRSAGGAIESAPAPAPVPERPVPKQAPAAATPARPARAAEEPVPEGATVIRAPMLGTFYRASAPGEKPFVEAGQRVKAGDTVCLIEVMKLFNSISAGVDGSVLRILVENGALVEYNQPMLYVMPARGKKA